MENGTSIMEQAGKNQTHTKRKAKKQLLLFKKKMKIYSAVPKTLYVNIANQRFPHTRFFAVFVVEIKKKQVKALIQNQLKASQIY